MDEARIMNNGRFASRIRLPLSIAVVALSALAFWAGDSFGQQRARTQKVLRPNPTISISGALHARVGLTGSKPEDMYLENVASIIYYEEWVVLNITEDEEPATLTFPREKVSYIKSWEVEPAE